MPSAKFKTVSLAFFVHQELRPDLAAPTALLSAVLERGNRRYPDVMSLRRELEQLYGAEMSTNIHKKGERHLISCSLEMVHGQYVGEKKLLEKGMDILAGAMFDPLEESGGFKQEYVDQEKEQLAKEIRGLINDKALYALEKCLERMCEGERFGVYKLGRLEDLNTIEPATLFNYYRQMFDRNMIDLYVVGDLPFEQVREAASKVFTFPRRPDPAGLPETVVQKKVEQVRLFEEPMPVSQSKLVMGYRTNIAFGHPLFYALMVYNGVLGGFPHSKLFLNVREKASLAYYIYSRLERLKGLMVIAAGIDQAQYTRAREIVENQVEEMVRGNISATEMENTRRSLASHLLTQEDNPYQMISFHQDGEIAGKPVSIREMVEGIQSVTVDQVQEVAGKIQLDTIYLLKGREGGGKS